jgi:hypothetical protein
MRILMIFETSMFTKVYRLVKSHKRVVNKTIVKALSNLKEKNFVYFKIKKCDNKENEIK